MLEVIKLEKHFGEVHALKGVSFTAPNGCITGLLGPNGAGKSTTLRILYTALAADSGIARIDNLDVFTQANTVRNRIGVLPHAAGLYQRLTARENIAYYGQLYGLGKNILRKRVGELVELLEMGDFIDRPARHFSQGQRLKVALARALVHKPSNIMLDEPTNGLDVMTTRALRDYVRKLRDEGVCVLFSSHVMQEVSALCDSIVIISQGMVVAHGTPGHIKAISSCDDLEDAFVRLTGRTGETE